MLKKIKVDMVAELAFQQVVGKRKRESRQFADGSYYYLYT